MPGYEALLLWITISAYVVASLAFMAAVFFKSEQWISTVLVVVGLIFNLATLVVRSIEVGHLPVRTMYELNLFGAWVMVGSYLLFQRRYPDTRLAGLVVLPFAFLMLDFGLLDKGDLSPLSPAYKNNWLVVHVLFAFVSYSFFAISTGCSTMFLLKGRNPEAAFYAKIPALAVLEELSFKFAGFGFVANTVMISSGALWARELWGKYWSWDPLETWSLIGWLVYGIFLHLRLTRGWRGVKLARFNLAALIVIFLSFWGVPYLTTTYHSPQTISNVLSR